MAGLLNKILHHLLLLLCSHSHNDVTPEPQWNVSMASVRGTVCPSIDFTSQIKMCCIVGTALFVYSNTVPKQRPVSWLTEYQRHTQHIRYFSTCMVWSRCWNKSHRLNSRSLCVLNTISLHIRHDVWNYTEWHTYLALILPSYYLITCVWNTRAQFVQN